MLFSVVLWVARIRESTGQISNGFCTARKPLKVYTPPPSSRKTCKDPIGTITQSQLSALDPTGDRKALFDYRRNPRSVKPGDILRVIFRNGDPFSGVCLSIRLRGVDTSFLLRNQLTRVGVEMSVKVFSPEVQSVEIVQRSEKRRRRARLYYLRYVFAPPSVYLGERYLLMHFLLQTTQTRYWQCGEHCFELPQEEVYSYGSANPEAVIEYGLGVASGFGECITIAHVTVIFPFISCYVWSILDRQYIIGIINS